jgi:hypothetical protein
MTMRPFVLASVLLGLTAVAIYSYGQLNFGRRTAAFFNLALGAQVGEARPGGGPPQSGRGVGRMGAGPVGPAAGDGASEGAKAPDGQLAAARAAADESPSANQRRSGDGRGRGSATGVSMTHVLQYAAILAFVTMLTFLTDRWLRALLSPARVA